MVSVSPWSVKGVEPEAREAAKIAARRSGLTIGQWLSHVIRAAATEQLAGASHAFSASPTPGVFPSAPIPHANAVTYPQGGPPLETVPTANVCPTVHPPAPMNDAIVENFRKLTSRIEESETKTRAAVAPLADQVEQLSEQIERVKVQTSRSTAPVERAVNRLSERLEKIEAARRAESASRRWSLFGTDG